jgi:transglutaminase-like putative cysteine protease
MRGFSGLLLLLVALPSLAQKAQHRSAWTEEQTSPRLLSRKITAAARTEWEKVDAIMQWISGNIGYNTGVLYSTPRKAPILYPAPPAEDTNALPPLNDFVAVNVLRRRVAVCDGYARLFASLCSYAGVKAELVSGYVRPDQGRKLKIFNEADAG